MVSLFLREGTNKSPSLPKEFPDVGAENGPPGLAKNHAPTVVDLRPGATLAGQKQYPGPREARLGMRDHTQRLRDAGILTESQSPCSTLLLPVRESGSNDYSPAQHLRTVDSAVVTIHPVVPDPYTLLSLLPAQASWFTCLDPKVAFSCLLPASQPSFAFEWEDPHTGRKTQLTWT